VNSISRQGFECNWSGRDAIFTNAFVSPDTVAGRGSEIEVGFTILNPVDNAEISEEAFKITVYDAGENLDESWGIAE